MISETFRALALASQLSQTHYDADFNNSLSEALRLRPEQCVTVPGRIQCENFVIQRARPNALNVVDLTGRVPNKKESEDWVGALRGFREGKFLMDDLGCEYYDSDPIPWKAAQRFYLVNPECLGEEFNT